MNKERRVKQLKKYSNTALIRLIIQLEEALEDLLDKKIEEQKENDMS